MCILFNKTFSKQVNMKMSRSHQTSPPTTHDNILLPLGFNYSLITYTQEKY